MVSGIVFITWLMLIRTAAGPCGGAQVSGIRWTTIPLMQCVVPLPIRKRIRKSYIKNKIVPVL